MKALTSFKLFGFCIFLLTVFLMVHFVEPLTAQIADASLSAPEQEAWQAELNQKIRQANQFWGKNRGILTWRAQFWNLPQPTVLIVIITWPVSFTYGALDKQISIKTLR